MSTISIVIVISIIAIAIITRSGWRPSAPRFHWGWWVMLAVIGAGVWYFNRSDSTSTTTTATVIDPASSTPASTTKVVEVLEPKGEYVTPCKVYIGWNYVVRTDGDPAWIDYGKLGRVFMPGKGRSVAPEKFRPGWFPIESGHTNNPNIQVWVYERIKISRP